MATHAPFARLAHYSCKFSEASHIFLKNGLWQMSASLVSTCQTACRMSASFRFLGILYSSDLLNLPNLEKTVILLPFWHCFSQKWPLANVGSTCQTAWWMSASLASISKLLDDCCEFGESGKIFEKGHFGECKYSPTNFFAEYLHLQNWHASGH